MAPSRAAAAMLAMLAVSRVVTADPHTPQLAPSRSDREDAHRLDVQRRELDQGGAAPVVVAPLPAPQSPSNTQRSVGLGFVVVAAGSLVVSGVSFGASQPGGDTTTAKVFLGLAVVSGVLGLSLVVSSRNTPPVTVAPAAGSGSVGVVLSGSL